MNDAKTDLLERKILDHITKNAVFTQPTGLYVSLHTADPTDASAGGNELVDGPTYKYARKAATFGAATTSQAGVTSAVSTNEIEWLNLPAGTVTYIGIWDAAAAGSLLYRGQLSSSKQFTNGDDFVIHAGSLVLSEA
jgi:hypothetical protein